MDFIPKYKDRFKGINEQEKIPVFEDVIGYESPITVIYGEMKTEQENEVLRVVRHYDIDVDKEELIKALKYDREQYSKGYADGIKKFAERLKKRMGFCDLPMGIVKDHIDLLVKEMVGDDNA